MKPRKETELGPPVVAWLQHEGWDVYQEVTGPGGCADVVATCGRLVAVVEMKLQLSWELLDQAHRWRAWAHLVWIAVPDAKRRWDGRMTAERVFEDHGIGIVSIVGPDRRLDVRRRPALNRRADIDWARTVLRPEHKTFAAAGSAAAPRWTTFKDTCAKLRRWVAQHPGALLRDAIAGIEHHYATGSSARAHISTLIQRGVIAGLRLERDGKALRIYPEGKPSRAVSVPPSRSSSGRDLPSGDQGC